MGFSLTEIYRSYSPVQRRNIGIYILGIMCYKLGLEFFNGSISALATDRFRSQNTFTKLGAASGLNQAAQCVGAILIAPLVKKFPTRTVLASAVCFFALMTSILLIVDAATGGSIKASASAKANYGSWNPDLIFVIWTLAGVAYGMVELIRRVIPADIVGGEAGKLRRMDAIVHVLYEVAGTSGAFASSAAIQRFGNNYSYLFSPIFFAIAGTIWFRVGSLNHGQVPTKLDANGEPILAKLDVNGEPVPASELAVLEKKKRNFFMQILHGFYLFGESIYFGAKIILSHRQFIWLLPAYALALYLHRFLESSIAPAFARRILQNSAFSQIFVGLSNLGELLGALTVFIFSDYITTPLPWLRLDALMLNLVWAYIPLSRMVVAGSSKWAWQVGSLNIPISFGWAAGDVSLAAYIQASLSNMEFTGHENVSPLGSVMAILYTTYIVLNAVFSTVLGQVIDRDFIANGNIFESLKQVAGIHFTVGSVIILLATLIPIGAIAWNPSVLGGVNLGAQKTAPFDDSDSFDEKKIADDEEKRPVDQPKISA